MSGITQVCVVVLLAAIALMIFRVLRGGLNLQLEEATRRLREAANHFGDASAIAELTKQLDNPELLAKLSVFPTQIVAAALTYRMSSIANDLGVAQRELSDTRGDLAKYGSLYRKDVDRLEQLVEHLLSELDTARQAADEFNAEAMA